MGVELKLQPIDWDYKEAELNEGTIDCIWNGMSIDAERQEKMCLSEPVYGEPSGGCYPEGQRHRKGRRSEG